MKALSRIEYRDIIDNNGGAKQYEVDGNNYFVVLNHRNNKFCYFTVNDGFEAPERVYMDLETAKKVTEYLNSIHIGE